MKIAYVFAGVVVLALAAAMLPGSDEEWTENPVETASDEEWMESELETGTDEDAGLMRVLQEGGWEQDEEIIADMQDPHPQDVFPVNTWIYCSVYASDWDHWTGPDPPEGDYQMPKTSDWWASENAGEWDGVEVDGAWWKAPSTPGEYTLYVRVDDVGEGFDDDAATDCVQIKIAKLVLTKCPSDWLPNPGQQSGIVSFTATIYPSGVTAPIRFELFDVGNEPGYCMNDPNPPDAQGPGSAGWKDLQFPDQTGFTITGDNHDVATKNEDAGTATVKVRCYDYGAYGKIRAIATIHGWETTAYEEGSETKEYTCIPLDDDANDIADGWTWNAGGTDDDNDSNPTGEGTPGDGLTRYEEYRGFVLGGTYMRLDPTKKDVFVRNVDVTDAGVSGFFTSETLGAPVHVINASECQSHVVNFNRGAQNGDPQQAIHVTDGGTGTGGWGATAYWATPPVPNHQSYCYVYVANIREGTKINQQGGISATDTTIPVQSTAKYEDQGIIRIEDEQISYGGKTAAAFTGCARGSNLTTASAHADQTKVYYFVNEDDMIKCAFGHEAGHLVNLQHMQPSAENMMSVPACAGTELGWGLWDTFIGLSSSLGDFRVKE